MDGGDVTTNERSKLHKLLTREIDPNAELTPKAADVIDKLVSRFVSEALVQGAQAADARKTDDIRPCDMRPFVQDRLKLDAVGFAMEDLFDEGAVGSRAVVRALRRKHTSKKHQSRLQQKQRVLEAEAEAQALLELQQRQIVAGSVQKKAKSGI